MKNLRSKAKAYFSYIFLAVLLIIEGITFAPQVTASALGVVAVFFLTSYVLFLPHRQNPSRFPIRDSILRWTLLCLISVLLGFFFAPAVTIASTIALVIFIAPMFFEGVKAQHEILRRENLSIVELIDTNKTANANKAMLLLSLSVLLFNLVGSFGYTEVQFSALCLLAALGIIIWCKRWIENYRITKGYYGTNEQEAREIIRFIIKNSDDIDFTGGGPKDLIPGQDIESFVLKNHITHSEPAS